MQFSRRTALAGAAVLASAATFGVFRRLTALPDATTPEGLYCRVGMALNEDRTRDLFLYLEDEAERACDAIKASRRAASARIDAAYPEPERTKWLTEYAPIANAEDVGEVWRTIAKSRGYEARLRRDMSGIARIEMSGDAATIETAKGTRYGLRKREDGHWGLTLFTVELVAEADRAARDAEVVEQAAGDYERARTK